MTPSQLPKGEKQELIRQFALNHPHITSDRGMASALMAVYPLIFDDFGKTRNSVRYTMGKGASKFNVRTQKAKTELNDFIVRIAKLRDEFNLDFREQSDKTPFDLNYNKILVIGDLHYPYTDISALQIALDYGTKNGIEAIVLNGDILDFSTIAKYIAKPTDMRVTDQIDGVQELLAWMQKAMNVPIVFHAGNHDKRIEDYMIRQAPELWNRNRLEKLLGLEEMRIDYVEEYRFMRFGKLNIAHGHHIVKGIFAPVNPARGVFIKTNCSTMINHVHRTSEHIEVDMNGKQIGCFSVGAMCDVKPDYNPQVSKHQIGFAVVEKDESGEFEVHNKKILNGKVR